MAPLREPLVSVVIPTLGRDDRLADALGDLRGQGYSRWECLVVSQGGGAQELARRGAACLPGRVRVFRQDEPNASVARNVGLIEARGEVVLFLDDDVRIGRPDFLACHARHYADGTVSGVAGQVLGVDGKVRPELGRLARLARNGWVYFPRNFAGRARVRDGASVNLSVRREEALAVGGMDGNFERGAHREESDFCLRYTDAYGLMVFDPEASLVHLAEPAGGCRSWGLNEGVYPLHHVAGEWYFLLRGLEAGTVGVGDLPHHLAALVRRQLLNRANAASPRRLAGAVAQCARGLRLARARLRAGPRLARSVRPGDYREVAP